MWLQLLSGGAPCTQLNHWIRSAMESLRFNDLILNDLVDSFDAATRIEIMADVSAIIRMRGTQSIDF